MALTSGTKLGPYEIVSPLGAGGMGEVYRARDTRLERTVAIKVLPSHPSSDPGLKYRFEREARTISSLNHPHICHLYDVGSQDLTDYLVMEYLEGESLDHRLQKGPLPLKQALEYGVQICEALEKAHRAGVVHRDLKPGNIMLTESGAKLMDFGLAKPAAAVLGAGASPGGSPLTPSTPTMNLPALSAPAGALTQKGTIVGTFQYMAPEVLRGQEADTRSDLFSLGCVLYEMVTGRRAFEGKSQLSVLTAILEKDPDSISAVQPTTPPALDYAVQSCLEKNPDERCQTAHDVKLQLAWIAKAGSQGGTSAPVANKRRTTEVVLSLTASVLAIMVVALLSGWWRAQPVRRVTRSTLLPPEGTHFAPLYRNGPPALSSDGTRMAFVASRDGRTSLWVRTLDKLDATELAGTEGAYYPFWSPDGRSIGFFANGRLWRMDASGGSTIAICNASDARGGTWGASDVILWSDSITVERVAASGGTPAPASPTHWNAVNNSDRWPFFLPDGKHFLYLHSPIGAGDDRNEIRFASVDGKANKLLLKGRYYNPEYALGWLLVGRSGTLVAQKLDPSSGELSGDPVQVSDNLQIDDNVGSSVFSVSQNGALVYQKGSGRGGMHHFWVDPTGKQLAQVSELGVYGATRISPDGTKVATLVFEQAGEVNIWLWDLAHGTRSRISSGGVADTPVWSPDGRSIYYAYSPRGGHLQVFQRPVDGSRGQQLLFAAPTDSLPEDVSRDAKWLLYQETLADRPEYSAVKAYPLAGGAQAVVVLAQVDFGSNAVLMPGSNEWLAYQSNESGRPEIYLTHFPNPGARYQVSLAGGTQPVWGKDGRRLYYLDAGQKLTVVDIRTDKDSVQVGAPKILFQTSVMTSLNGAGYDLTRDGRFLVLNWAFETPAPLTLVMNWDAEPKK
jgi:eukaryotic-like serine/threonine-protein kinase